VPRTPGVGPLIITKPTTLFIHAVAGQFAAAKGFFGIFAQLTNWLITHVITPWHPMLRRVVTG
jgi:hypothetical protein